MIYRNKITNSYFIIDEIFYKAVKDILKFPKWMQIENHINISELKNIEFIKLISKLRKDNGIN